MLEPTDQDISDNPVKELRKVQELLLDDLWSLSDLVTETETENAMAGCVYKTSAKEPKIEAGELGRAAGTAVPHHCPGTSQREARESCAPLGPYHGGQAWGPLR